MSIAPASEDLQRPIHPVSLRPKHAARLVVHAHGQNMGTGWQPLLGMPSTSWALDERCHEVFLCRHS